MTNEELAKKALLNIMKMMAIKWGIILGINAAWRRQIRKAEMRKADELKRSWGHDPR